MDAEWEWNEIIVRNDGKAESESTCRDQEHLDGRHLMRHREFKNADLYRNISREKEACQL